jgi:urease accessory protein
MDEGHNTIGLGRPAVSGRSLVAFKCDDAGIVRLADLDQRDPLKILFPDPLDEQQPVAVLANTGGGVVGGDRLSTEIRIGDGATALVVGQAAEKIYRSWGPPARVENLISVGVGGRVEWFPQETIMFDQARLDRRLTVELAKDAEFLGGEIVVLGRRARGETMTGGALADRWFLRQAGRLVWADATLADPLDDLLLARPALFGGARAMATLVCVCADPAAALAIGRAQPEISGGLVGRIFVARLLDSDPAALRQRYVALWCALRGGLFGLPERVSRLWHV